jgi:hypothetical protein
MRENTPRRILLRQIIPQATNGANRKTMGVIYGTTTNASIPIRVVPGNLNRKVRDWEYTHLVAPGACKAQAVPLSTLMGRVLLLFIVPTH